MKLPFGLIRYFVGTKEEPELFVIVAKNANQAKCKALRQKIKVTNRKLYCKKHPNQEQK